MKKKKKKLFLYSRNKRLNKPHIGVGLCILVLYAGFTAINLLLGAEIPDVAEDHLQELYWRTLSSYTHTVGLHENWHRDYLLRCLELRYSPIFQVILSSYIAGAADQSQCFEGCRRSNCVGHLHESPIYPEIIMLLYYPNALSAILTMSPKFQRYLWTIASVESWYYAIIYASKFKIPLDWLCITLHWSLKNAACTFYWSVWIEIQALSNPPTRR